MTGSSGRSKHAAGFTCIDVRLRHNLAPQPPTTPAEVDPPAGKEALQAALGRSIDSAFHGIDNAQIQLENWGTAEMEAPTQRRWMTPLRSQSVTEVRSIIPS